MFWKKIWLWNNQPLAHFTSQYIPIKHSVNKNILVNYERKSKGWQFHKTAWWRGDGVHLAHGPLKTSYNCILCFSYISVLGFVHYYFIISVQYRASVNLFWVGAASIPSLAIQYLPAGTLHWLMMDQPCSALKVSITILLWVLLFTNEYPVCDNSIITSFKIEILNIDPLKRLSVQDIRPIYSRHQTGS